MLDYSPRTTRITKFLILNALCIVVLIACIIGEANGLRTVANVKARSSTPIGSALEFPRSKANIVIKDLYVDKTGEALIVRFTSDVASSSRLPFKGSDYKVFLSSPSLEGYKKATVLFGRMSTDGDMFLVIPKPTDDIYSVFIMNTKYVANDTVDTSTSTNDEIKNIETEDAVVTNSITDEDVEQSISKSLSEYEYGSQENTNNTYKIASNRSDITSFRVTKNPVIKDAEYKPKVLDADLIKDNQFDFDAFFNVVFKKPIIERLDKESQDISQRIKNMQTAKREAEDRLAVNPNDSDAKSQLDSLISSEETLKQKQIDIAKKSSEYANVKFKKEYFSNLQTKAKVIDMQE